MGAATAYYLSLSPQFARGTVSVTLVEEIGIACSASGKSAGFLAKDWHVPETTPLADLSYRLHQTLADTHGGVEKWGYRATSSISITARESFDKKKHASQDDGEDAWLAGIGGIRHRGASIQDVHGVAMLPEPLKWIDPTCISGVNEIGSLETTSQVDPESLTHFLLAEAVSKGVKVVMGTATRVRHENNTLVALEVNDDDDNDDTVVPCDKLVLAAGAWTGRLYDTLFSDCPDRTKVSITGFAGTSLLLRSATTPASSQRRQPPLSAHAVFGSLTMADGSTMQPEFFSRAPNDEIWIGGMNEYSHLPQHAGLVKPNPDHVQHLKRASQILFGDDLKVTREALCYRPVNKLTDRPVIGKINHGLPNGVFLCAGHSVWGITLGPGSGKVMSELLLDGHSSTDISALAP